MRFTLYGWGSKRESEATWVPRCRGVPLAAPTSACPQYTLPLLLNLATRYVPRQRVLRTSTPWGGEVDTPSTWHSLRRTSLCFHPCANHASTNNIYRTQNSMTFIVRLCSLINMLLYPFDSSVGRAVNCSLQVNIELSIGHWCRRPRVQIPDEPLWDSTFEKRATILLVTKTFVRKNYLRKMFKL